MRVEPIASCIGCEGQGRGQFESCLKLVVPNDTFTRAPKGPVTQILSAVGIDLDRSQPPIWALRRRYETHDSTRPKQRAVRRWGGHEDRWKEVRNAVALRQRKKRVILQVPSGLAVSSDDDVRRKLAHVLRQCALAPELACTVAESGMVLAGQEISVVVCNDRMDDGKYEDIVKLVVRCETKVPVIVVSRTGDWAEYLTAMCGGTFDYLVYPPMPGDLQ